MSKSVSIATQGGIENHISSVMVQLINDIVEEYRTMESDVAGINVSNLKFTNHTRYNSAHIAEAIARLMVIKKALAKVYTRNFTNYPEGKYCELLELITTVYRKSTQQNETHKQSYSLSPRLNESKLRDAYENFFITMDRHYGTNPEYNEKITRFLEKGYLVPRDVNLMQSVGTIHERITTSGNIFNSSLEQNSYYIHARNWQGCDNIDSQVNITLEHVSSESQNNPPKKRRYRYYATRGQDYRMDCLKLLSYSLKGNPNLIVRSSGDSNGLKVSISNVKNLIDKNNVLEEVLLKANDFKITHLDSLAILSEFVIQMSATTSPTKYNHGILFQMYFTEILMLVFSKAHPDFIVGILPKNETIKNSMSKEEISRSTNEKLKFRLECINKQTYGMISRLSNNAWPASNAMSETHTRFENTRYHLNILSKNFDFRLKNANGDFENCDYEQIHIRSLQIMNDYQKLISDFHNETRQLAYKLDELWTITNLNFKFRTNEDDGTNE